MLLESMLNVLVAPAHAAEAAPEGGLLQLLPLGILFVVMYFLMIRPQQKKAKEHGTMVAALKKGDEVVTTGGLLGKVAEVGDTFLTIKLNDNVEVNIQRQAVSALMPKGTVKGAK